LVAGPANRRRELDGSPSCGGLRDQAEVLPLLYLRGLSTGDFREALPVLLGEKASALSPTAHSEMASRQWLDRGAPGEAG